MNKKGMIFHVGIVLVVIIIMVQIYSVASNKDEKIDYNLGHQQFSIYQQYQEAADKEAFLQMHTQSFLKQALELAASKGWVKPSQGTQAKGKDCGQYQGYQLWQTEDKSFEECAPESPNSATESYFNELFFDVLEEAGIDSLSFANLDISDTTRFDIVGPGVTLRKGITTKSVQSYGGMVSPPIVDYDQATALHSPSCTNEERSTPGACALFPKEDFSTLYSIKDPLANHLEIASDAKDGNAMTKELASVLLDLGEAWHDQECKGHEDCKARLYISSISTGSHSDTSNHYIGNAADISRCRDKDGKIVYAYEYYDGRGETFGDCYELIADYYKKNLDGEFYGPDNDKCYKGKTPCTQAQYASLIDSHKDHIHLSP
ncbi:MAG: hypothetical protein ACLFP2_00460 [Candidatus Woesearchaeota archaeon]